MELIRNHPRLTLAVIGLAIVLLAILGLTSSRGGTTDTQKTTPVTSDFSVSSETPMANTDVHGAPNLDAVQPPLTIFALNSLPISSELKYEVQEQLPSILARETIPTYARAYIQVDRRTIDCSSEYDCSFSFYLDSPERYYYYRSYYKPDGSTAHTLTQMPLPGAAQ